MLEDEEEFASGNSDTKRCQHEWGWGIFSYGDPHGSKPIIEACRTCFAKRTVPLTLEGTKVLREMTESLRRLEERFGERGKK